MLEENPCLFQKEYFLNSNNSHVLFYDQNLNQEHLRFYHQSDISNYFGSTSKSLFINSIICFKRISNNAFGLEYGEGMTTIVVKSDESLKLCGNVIIHKQDTRNEFELNDLQKLSILTTDQGPVSDDVAMALFVNDDVIVLPSEHACYQEFYDSLSKRINYDYGKVIEAMSCAKNAEFIVWEKDT